MTEAIAISRFDTAMVKTQQKVRKWLSNDYRQVRNSLDEITLLLNKMRPILSDLTERNWVIPIALEDNASAGIAAIEKKVKSLITPKVMEIQANIKTSMKSNTTSDGSKNIAANRSVTNRTVSYNQYGMDPTPNTRPVTQYPISDALNTHKLLSTPIVTKQLDGLGWGGELTGITGLGDGAKQTGIFGRKIGRRTADSSTHSLTQLSRINPNQLGGTNFMTRFGSNLINNGIRQSEVFGAGITGRAGSSTAGQVGNAVIGHGLNALGTVGTVVADMSVSQGINDLTNAFNATDKDERNTYMAAGALETAGPAIGAAIGTAILPGIGTAIGAGLGGLIGLFGGDKIKKDHEEKERKEREKERKKLIKEEKAKYSNQYVKDAIGDASVSAEKMAILLQRAINIDMKERFGDIKLNMEQISEIAKGIVFGDQAESLQRFSYSAESAKQSLEQLNTTDLNLDKLNFKKETGPGLTRKEKKEYKQLSKEYVTSSRDYLLDQQYNYSNAAEVLYGNDKSKKHRKTSFEERQEEYYGKQTKRLNKQVSAYNTAIENGEDGEKQRKRIERTIEKPEREARQAAMAQITGEGFSELDPESVRGVLDAIKQETETRKSQNLDAYMDVSTLTELERRNGTLTDKEANSEQLNNKTDFKDANERVDAENDAQYKNAIEQFKNVYSLGEDSKGNTLDFESMIAQLKKENEKDPMETWSPEDLAEYLKMEPEDSKESQESLTNLLMVIQDYLQLGPKPGMSSNTDGSEETATQAEISTEAKLVELDPEAMAEEAALFREKVQEIVDLAFETALEANVKLKAVYTLMNPNVTFGLSNLGSLQFSAHVAAYAEGGMVGNPTLSLIGEDGPEAIIPLGGKRRNRGISLWEQAGNALGISVGASSNSLESEIGYMAKSGNDDESEPIPVVDASQQKSNTGINLQMNVTPNFEINGEDASQENVLQVIKSHFKEMTDEIGGELAVKLESVFSNMPLSNI